VTDEHDPNPWAPTADGEETPASLPPAPVPPPVSVPTADPAPDPTPAPPVVAVPANGSPEEPIDAESVAVGPVAAVSRRGKRWVGRGLALALASLLIGGGGYLTFSAGSARGGADSPEAALEMMLEALSAGDLIAAAELVEPTERVTLIAAGFDFADELARLDVLAEDLDLAVLTGVDGTVAGFDVRAEFPRSGLAHLFVERIEVSGGIDVSELPLGPLLRSRLPAGWLDFDELDSLAIEATSMPVVAVEREGRWYLSGWYSVAENARLAADQPLPDLGRRPARIGADTPEEAVRSLVDKVMRLDVRRMIGMFDPDEMAALYDYAPLFLDAATRAANQQLESLEESGWAWNMESLDLSAPSIEGDVATIEVNGFTLSAQGQAETLLVEFDTGGVSAVFDGLDFWGDPYRVDLQLEAGCLRTTRSDTSGVGSERSCADRLLGSELDPDLRTPFGVPDDLSVVTHKVDDRWFISPIRSGTETYLGVLRSLSPDQLGATIDGFGALVDRLDRLNTADTLDSEITGGRRSPPLDPESAPDRVQFPPPTNSDLFGEVEVVFAFDLDSERANSEIDLWAPMLADTPVSRGVAATVLTESGEAALTVLVTPTAEDAAAARQLLTNNDDVIAFDIGVNRTFLYLVSDVENPVVVAIRDDRVVIVASLGAAIQHAIEVADRHVQ